MNILYLQQIREKKKLSKVQLSYQSGIARGYITELENGKYDNPSVKIVCNLCKALKVTPNDLINEDLYKS
ncbi:helix-turn-helix domain-containing protein [Cellulosilyticum sp. I15G10I2]|uniref:helix-turn-helix domain-containing protein n=1 Tax=Cellulosilyticum sp. I15G10I2 TaxID=1892843 RepID=UPI00085BBE37|nr:helix-turn-helix transcriptional regulator [Cellulosilyticum sp. I15G10I2]